jgi:hypothetical protein
MARSFKWSQTHSLKPMGLQFTWQQKKTQAFEYCAFPQQYFREQKGEQSLARERMAETILAKPL